MASIDRRTIINEGKQKAGLDSLQLTLNQQYERGLREISSRFPLVKNVYATGNLTAHASNNYLTAPTDMRQPEHMKAGSSSTEVFFKTPNDFDSKALSFGASTVPSEAKWIPADARIYLNGFPSTGTIAYYLWYNKYHAVPTADTDTNLFGEEFDETLSLWMAYKAAEAAESPEEDMEWWRQRYEEDFLMKAKIKMLKMVDPEPYLD